MWHRVMTSFANFASSVALNCHEVCRVDACPATWWVGSLISVLFFMPTMFHAMFPE